MFDTGGLAGKVAQAHALLADVAAAISSETGGPEAAEMMVELIGASGQLDVALCLTAERIDRSGQFAADNAVSTASWLRYQSHSSGHWASIRVNAGRALVDQLPATKKAWLAGDLTLEHADVIRRAVAGQPERLVALLDTALANSAALCSPQDLRDIANRLLEEFAPDEQDNKRERNAGKARAHLSDTPDGGRLDADLDHEGTAVLRAALDKYMPKPDPEQQLSASQRRAQALVEMARQSLDFDDTHPGSAHKPHLVLSLSADQLREQTGVAYTPGGGTVPMSTVRKLACDATVIPLVLDGAGLPLDIGRKSRVIPWWIRVALNERDKGCRAPGCDRPPAWADVHHCWHWADGGPTSLDNCCLLCRRHHTMVHQGKLRIEALGKQQFRFTNTATTGPPRRT